MASPAEGKTWPKPGFSRDLKGLSEKEKEIVERMIVDRPSCDECEQQAWHLVLPLGKHKERRLCNEHALK